MLKSLERPKGRHCAAKLGYWQAVKLSGDAGIIADIPNSTTVRVTGFS
jgi:hypothetical protein